MEEKIQEWLKIKKEQVGNHYVLLNVQFHCSVLTCMLFVFLQFQEKKVKLVKQCKEEEIQRQQEKQREIEQRAQQKYKNWLQKKNQEKLEVEKKEKVTWVF